MALSQEPNIPTNVSKVIEVGKSIIVWDAIDTSNPQDIINGKDKIDSINDVVEPGQKSLYERTEAYSSLTSGDISQILLTGYSFLNRSVEVFLERVKLIDVVDYSLSGGNIVSFDYVLPNGFLLEIFIYDEKVAFREAFYYPKNIRSQVQTTFLMPYIPYGKELYVFWNGALIRENEEYTRNGTTIDFAFNIHIEDEIYCFTAESD